jgi:hypothetical protein
MSPMETTIDFKYLELLYGGLYEGRQSNKYCDTYTSSRETWYGYGMCTDGLVHIESVFINKNCTEHRITFTWKGLWILYLHRKGLL